jgi:hypothetical protein
MKLAQIVIALLIGLLALPMEFQSSIKGGLMGSPHVFKYFLIIVLVALAIAYLFMGIKAYRSSQEKSEFLPLITVLILLGVIYGHILYRDKMDNSKSAFTAYTTEKIEGRESTEIDFKTNGYLKVHVANKFTDDYYWGKYEKRGDTLLLDVETDFKLKKRAIIQGDTLRFVGDSTLYRVRHSFS